MTVALALLVSSALLLAAGTGASAAPDAPLSPHQLPAMPAGLHLQSYDDCGVPGRQPHIREAGIHTYAPGSCNGGERALSISWAWDVIHADYTGLSADRPYAVAVTYANETFNGRVQSLWAGGVCLHPAHPLPRGGAERLMFAVPQGAIRDGKLTLEFRLEGPVNVVVSAVELWSDEPSPDGFRLVDLSALAGPLTGRLLDLAWSGVPQVRIGIATEAGELAHVTTDANGTFRVARNRFEAAARTNGLDVAAEAAPGLRVTAHVAPSEIYYEPIRYRPLPASVLGDVAPWRSLNGSWLVSTEVADARARATNDPGWKPFRVPGQWVQQGIDVAADKHVAMAREFEVPAAWRGRRVILRFDAIHAGVRYWMNGKELGYSECLYTPVEWDVTDTVRFGAANRLDLDMVQETESEALSFSSGYAFHSLAGIDRSVRIFSLPQTHVRTLWIDAELDSSYRDGELGIKLNVVGVALLPNARLRVSLAEASGARPRTMVDRPLRECVAADGSGKLSIGIASPRRWTAETPDLYRLDIDIMDGRAIVERVRRSIGFRRVEVKGSKLLINGVPVKLAGACHHETHPLTGRADTARFAGTDVALLRDAGLNYLRTSHYPPNTELLEQTDRQGVYVEVEAPFCWVGEEGGFGKLRKYLDPTSAMVDYHGHHPSVIVWSVANESAFNACFEQSAKLIKELDRSRATTFNNPDPKRICDIANVHYPLMPFDDVTKDDPRPLFLGEWYFPVCHEQTDVRLNPGLRELWGAGQSDPESPHGRACAAEYGKPFMQPGEPPGAWTSIVRSERVLGGAIWAQLDEPYFLPGGKQAGYAWVHGFWGITDAWRRPKPEQWLSKLIFSPVWFPKRRLEWSPAMRTVELPVENRYSFTNLRGLTFEWALGSAQGVARTTAGPGQTGMLAIPVPGAIAQGSRLEVRAKDARGSLVSACVATVGSRRPPALPSLSGAPPRVCRAGGVWTIAGRGYALNIEGETGAVTGSGSASAIRSLPMPHLTRFDFGDLRGPNSPPYAVFPTAGSRVIESLTVEVNGSGAEVRVQDRWDRMRGVTTWRLSSAGLGEVAWDYEVTGDAIDAREEGMRVLLAPECRKLSWRRESEWGVYPKESISREAGSAVAARGPKAGTPLREQPTWTWARDETEQGSADFRSVKLNVTRAAVSGPAGGLRVVAAADRHVRTALAPEGTWLHVLTRCAIGPRTLTSGDRLHGTALLELAGRR
jgi:hypothetical protein